MLKSTARILSSMESTQHRRSLAVPVDNNGPLVRPQTFGTPTAIILLQDMSELGSHLLMTLLQIARSLLRYGIQ